MGTTVPMLACPPRYATPRTLTRKTRGAEVAVAAETLGLVLMDWQRAFFDVAMEIDNDTGLPAYRELICTTTRQSGKTVAALSFEIHRAIFFPGSQVAYTAQRGHDARLKFLNDQVPLLEAKGAPIRSAIAQIHRGSGNEGVSFSNGSRLFLLASTPDAGHGRTVSAAVLDELHSDSDDRRLQALVPSMITVDSGQLLVVSTAGTERSPVLKRLVDRGRASVANRETSGTCFWEWSADPEDDPADPKTWASCNPALGNTISIEALRQAQASLPPAEFARAHLNLWTSSDERLLPAAIWNLVNSPDVAPTGSLALALEVTPDRSAAAIVAADSEGRVELVAHRPGLGWVVAEVVRLAKKHDAEVVLDGRGPASSLADEIENEDVSVHRFTTAEMCSAAAGLYDKIADAKVQIRRHDAMDLAASACRRRMIGDSWIFGRRDSAEDIGPIIACSMAVDAAHELTGDDFLIAWA